MPLQAFEAVDAVAEVTRFQTSPVYEMIISLRTLLRPGRHTTWANRVRAALPQAFLDELEAVYVPYADGMLFFELAVDYPTHDDVPGFIDYVRAMDPVTFMFYIIGRVIPREQLAATELDPRRLEQALAEADYHASWLCAEKLYLGILNDVPAFQERLASLWTWYWELFFAEEVARCEPAWLSAIPDKESLLARDGGLALLEDVTGRREMPPPLPADQPVQDVVFIPIQRLPVRSYMFFGYGNVTVLFDAARTQARIAQIEQDRDNLLAMFKALSDGTRLEVLRVIASSDGKKPGKKIAETLNLSASAVSRHIGQLRDAGLIVEQAQGDRTITYQLQQEALANLPERLLDYLYH